jgi:hypothetical protein
LPFYKEKHQKKVKKNCSLLQTEALEVHTLMSSGIFQGPHCLRYTFSSTFGWELWNFMFQRERRRRRKPVIKSASFMSCVLCFFSLRQLPDTLLVYFLLWNFPIRCLISLLNDMQLSLPYFLVLNFIGIS